MTVIVNDTNRGLAAANNQGIAATQGRYLIISNPDVLFQPRTIDELIACAERHPRAAFVISKLRSPGGQLQTSVGDMPVLREALLGRRASPGEPPLALDLASGGTVGHTTKSWPSGTAWSVAT